MIASDVVVLVMATVTLVYILSRGRGGHASHVDTVVMRSIPGLIIAGTLFGALVIAMVGYSVAMIVLHPMDLTHLRRIGPVHDWAFGIAALALGLVFGIVPYALFGRLFRILREQRTVAAARPTPVVVQVARVADLASARRTALARITPSATVDQLAATARDYLRDGYLTPPADVQVQWQPLLDRFDAARFGGASTDATELAAELRALVGGARE